MSATERNPLSPAPNQVPYHLPKGFSTININGEEYVPRPHEVDPSVPEDYVWSQFPFDSKWLSDTEWYDSLGQDQIVQRRIWSLPSEQAQIDQFRQLLHEFPNRALDLMFKAAVKGKAYIIKFLLAEGVKATANEAEGDDGSSVPLHAAAYQGRIDCVKLLIADKANGGGGLDANILDDIGGTPLMRACWGKQVDIVHYLIENGADVDVRQTKTPDNFEEGTSAFEFASGSGCVECAEAILTRAAELGLGKDKFFTKLAVAGAAASDSEQMLHFILAQAGYPLLDADKTVFDHGITLTYERKEALEFSLQKTLDGTALNNLKPMAAYINSRDEASEYNFEALIDDTTSRFPLFLLEVSNKDTLAHLEAFRLIYNMIFGAEARFATEETAQKKTDILGDAFFWAAQHNALDMMKLICELDPDLDINHLSRARQPSTSSALYTAAGNGFDRVVQWLFDTFPGRLNPHLGVGRYANGPTAMWIATTNGKSETVKLLLQRGGGPVEEIKGDVQSVSNATKQIVISAEKAYRTPVIVWSHDAWIEVHGDYGENQNGTTGDEAGVERHYVVVTVDNADSEWLGQILLRKSNEELLETEKLGRECKSVPQPEDT